jgi:murein DD-endopeptidase MepM/ murein hydrolase activator NlpD
MAFQLKHIGFAAFLLVGGLFGWYGYFYFIDDTPAQISIGGVESGGYYSGEVKCSVSANKSGEVSLCLDGQPLVDKFKIKGGAQEYPFAIQSQRIANGEHTLRVEFVESTFKKKGVVHDEPFYVDNTPLQAAFVKSESEYKVFQGRTLHVQFQVNKQIKEARINTLSSSYEAFPESELSTIYETYIPITCEQNPNEYLLDVAITDRVGNTLSLDNKFQVVVFPFKKHTLHVTAEKVAEEKGLGQPNAAERERVLEELAKNSPKQKLWNGAFCTPIDIARVSVDFGTVRTTQEKGRYKHKALDVVNTPRAVVWASQDGIVALKDRFEDAGNAVVIDHGWGLLSLFYHLEDFADIEVGQKITQGNPVGTIGKSGYATGYHLHWEMRMNNIAIDPMQWTKSNF